MSKENVFGVCFLVSNAASDCVTGWKLRLEGVDND